MRSATRLVAVALLFAIAASTVAPQSRDGRPAATGTVDRWRGRRQGAALRGGPVHRPPQGRQERGRGDSRAGKHGVKADRTFRHAVRGYAAHLAADQLAALRSDPDVQAVVPDEVISMAGQSIPAGVRRVNGRESLIADINGDGRRGGRRRRDRGHGDRRKDSRRHEDLNIAGG